MQICKPWLWYTCLVLTRPECNCYAESLAASSLASFQGPALLAYNDGKVFSEQDYASISSLGNSVKKDQKGKTGRFGVGFNAAYHLTDLPSFVSGELTAYAALAACLHKHGLGHNANEIRSSGYVCPTTQSGKTLCPWQAKKIKKKLGLCKQCMHLS